MNSLRPLSTAMTAHATPELAAPFAAYATSAAERHRLLRQQQREIEHVEHKVEFKKFKKNNGSCNTFYEMVIPESSAEKFRRQKSNGEICFDFDHQNIPVKPTTTNTIQKTTGTGERKQQAQQSSFPSLFSGLAILAIVGSGLYWKFISHSEAHPGRSVAAVMSTFSLPAVSSNSKPVIASAPGDLTRPQPLLDTNSAPMIRNAVDTSSPGQVKTNAVTAPPVTGALPCPTTTVTHSTIAAPLWLQRTRSDQSY